MTEEEKGFIIKDRRSFDDKGEPKEKDSTEEKVKEEPKEETQKGGPRRLPCQRSTFPP